MSTLRIATRASALALAQARIIAARIESELSVATELIPIKTRGDRLQDVSLAKLGGKGLFVKEIEEALLERRADIAVHSAKDLPAGTTPGLALVAFPERVGPRDALVARERGASLASLPAGARIGTGSARRSAQLRALRPDLEVVPLRGNVSTRLEKLETEGLDAVILACAGLERLGLASRIDERIAPESMLPAVGQGVLALQGREGDSLSRDIASLSEPDVVACIDAERGFLCGLGGDCTTPLAALAERDASGDLRLRALLASEDGTQMLRFEGRTEGSGAEALGAAAAARVLADGGDALLAALRSGAAT
jgi:hydroxymethylbilane synthase